MSFGALLEEARDISMQERFAVALKAKLLADELSVDDVDADLEHVVLKKNTFESLAKLQQRIPPGELRESTEQMEFIVRRILLRYQAPPKMPPAAKAPSPAAGGSPQPPPDAPR